MVKTYKVSGMTCQGCVRSVTNAIKALAPEAGVTVDLATGQVYVDGLDNDDLVAEAVDNAGFEFGGLAPAKTGCGPSCACGH